MRCASAVLRPLWPAVFLFGVLWLGACGHSKDGPTPQTGEGAGTNPQAVCVEQLKALTPPLLTG